MGISIRPESESTRVDNPRRPGEALRDLWDDLMTRYAAARARGERVTPQHVEEYIRERSNGAFGVEDLKTPAMLERLMSDVANRYEAARANGLKVSRADIDEYMRESSAGLFGVEDVTKPSFRNVARSVLQGLTFNFADEILGMFSPQAGRESKVRARLFREDHPGIDLAAGAAGALATLPVAGWRGPGVFGATRAGGLGRAVASGIKAGAAGGAAAGIGAGDTMEERLSGGAVGATAGGVLGGALSGLVGGVKRFVSPKVRAERTLQQTIKSAGGEKVLLERLDEIVRAGRGDDVMTPDLAPELRYLAEQVAVLDPRAHLTLEERVLARNANHAARVLDDVRGVVGNPRAKQRLARMQKDRREWARGAYDALREQNIEIRDPDAFARFLSQPRISAIWKRAQDLNYLGDPPRFTSRKASMRSRMVMKPDPDNPGAYLLDMVEEGPPPSFELLQTTLEQVEDAATRAFRAGNGNLGRRLREVQDGLHTLLSEQVDGFSKVQAEYRRRLQLEKALELGEKWYGIDDTRELPDLLASMTKEELGEFRFGIASKLVSALRNARRNSREANKLLMASEAQQDKLRLIFGSRKAFEDFMRKMGVERNFTRLEQATNRSPTARRQYQAQNLGEAMSGAFTEGPVGDIAQRGARSVIRFGRRRLREREARELTPFLTTQGAKAVRDAIRRAANPPNYVPMGARVGAPLIGGGLLMDVLNNR